VGRRRRRGNNDAQPQVASRIRDAAHCAGNPHPGARTDDRACEASQNLQSIATTGSNHQSLTTASTTANIEAGRADAGNRRRGGENESRFAGVDQDAVVASASDGLDRTGRMQAKRRRHIVTAKEFFTSAPTIP
jgi:hypothetical protein